MIAVRIFEITSLIFAIVATGLLYVPNSHPYKPPALPGVI